MILRHGNSIIIDLEEIRRLLGKSSGATKVTPGDIPGGSELYVQSTRANRKLS